MTASVLFSGWNWRWLAAGICIVMLGLLIWGYRNGPAGLTRWFCFLLKVLGVAGLVVCVLEPMWSGQRSRPGANLFALLVDNSQCLQIKDRAAARSHGEQLREWLKPEAGGWQSALEDQFEVRRYTFDGRLQTVTDFGGLSFDGRASALGSALRAVAERFRGRPLAGILLFTDGNATDLPKPPDCAGLPPVYPVVVGGSQPAKDLALQRVRTTQTDFEDAPVSIEAEVTAIGYSGDDVVAEVLDEVGKPAAQQTLTAHHDNQPLVFRFRLRPTGAGLVFYRVRVQSRGEHRKSDATRPSEEATTANNAAIVAVNRGHGPYRILYVSGRPNWEFKFLNRAVQEDDQLQLVGLIRVARREPKFNFIGRTGETSNPLYRGFGNQNAEEVERYDQPVLIRLNTRDELELRSGFPRTAEELYSYHAVIVDDIEAAFFSPDQAGLLQKYVSERGGGFLMLGGMESFQQGKYLRTPIGDMLPVYLDRVEESKAPSSGWRFELTREGLLEPWARLRETEAEEKARQQAVVPFRVLNRVREVKPGASIIGTASDGGGKTYPALVVQRFGRGRTAALTLGDMWHWGLHDAEAHRDMDKAWRQLLRWLVTDVPNRVEIAVEKKAEDPNGAVELQARARDPKYQPLEGAGVRIEIQPVMIEAAPGNPTNSVHLSAEPSPKEPGVYQATYVPRLTGGYRATVCVTNSDGTDVGRALAGWSTDLAADEFRSIVPNVALLETIAGKTGGTLVRAEELGRFMTQLPRRQAPVMEAWSYPLWHSPILFGFALVCFALEWGLRRWKGMP